MYGGFVIPSRSMHEPLLVGEDRDEISESRVTSVPMSKPHARSVLGR